MFSPSLTARELLQHLGQRGLLDSSSQPAVEADIVASLEKEELPLYLRALAGVGAAIASTLFLGFLGISDLVDFNAKTSLLIWGTLFTGTALFLARHYLDNKGSLGETFMLQSSFCAMSIGKTLLALGLALVFQSSLAGSRINWSFTFATLIVASVSYPIYRLPIDRFLSSLAVLLSFHYSLVSYNYPPNPLTVHYPLVRDIFLIAQVATVFFILTSSTVKRDFIPIAYACVCSLCIGVLYSNPFFLSSIPTNLVTNFVFGAALIFSIVRAVDNREKLISEPILLACCASAVLMNFSLPGVLLCLFLMVLGYAQHERLLTLIAILFLPAFLFKFYYQLEATLLAKSSILILSGALLLLGASYIHFRKLDREIPQ